MANIFWWTKRGEWLKAAATRATTEKSTAAIVKICTCIKCWMLIPKPPPIDEIRETPTNFYTLMNTSQKLFLRRESFFPFDFFFTHFISFIVWYTLVDFATAKLKTKHKHSLFDVTRCVIRSFRLLDSAHSFVLWIHKLHFHFCSISTKPKNTALPEVYPSERRALAWNYHWSFFVVSQNLWDMHALSSFVRFALLSLSSVNFVCVFLFLLFFFFFVLSKSGCCSIRSVIYTADHFSVWYTMVLQADKFTEGATKIIFTT